MDLNVVLGTLCTFESQADRVLPAMRAIFAERAAAIGELRLAASVDLLAGIDVSQAQPLVVWKDDFDLIVRISYLQTAFVVAHELSHLALATMSNREEATRDHIKMVTEFIGATESADKPPDLPSEEADAVEARLRGTGYELSFRAITHKYATRDPEMPTSRLMAWQGASASDDFLQECMADFLGVACMHQSMGGSYYKGGLSLAAISALSNMKVLQYLDDLARGHHPELPAKEPHAGIWLAAGRVDALRTTLACLAMRLDGDAEMAEGLVLHSTNASEDLSKLVLTPLFYSVDFQRDHLNVMRDPRLATVVNQVAGSPNDLRRHLGFPASSPMPIDRYFSLVIDTSPRPNKPETTTVESGNA